MNGITGRCPCDGDGSTITEERIEGIESDVAILQGDVIVLQSDVAELQAVSQPSTGLSEGGHFTAPGWNAGVVEIQVSAGKGTIWYNGVVTVMEWPLLVAYTSDTGSIYVLLGSNGSGGANIITQFTIPTPDERRQRIYVGAYFVSPSTTQVLTSGAAPSMVTEPMAHVRDLAEAIGRINKNGNRFSRNAGNTKGIDKSIGTIYSIGANFNQISPVDPSSVALPELLGATFFYLTQAGVQLPGTTDIDTLQYDNGGTLTNVPPNDFSIQRIYVNINNVVTVEYGQFTYNTFSDALNAVGHEPHVSSNTVAILRSFLIVKHNASDLTADGLFIEADKFGGGSAGGSSGGGTVGISRNHVSVTWTGPVGHWTGGIKTPTKGWYEYIQADTSPYRVRLVAELQHLGGNSNGISGSIDINGSSNAWLPDPGSNANDICGSVSGAVSGQSDFRNQPENILTGYVTNFVGGNGLTMYTRCDAAITNKYIRSMVTCEYDTTAPPS
jgi:hypothetical protein